VVAATPSGWSGVCAGKTGVWLGSRLQSFNTWKGHPNCIAPGKRPRITLTPTLIFKDGAPVAAVSVAGGDGQDQVTLQVVLNMIDFDLPPDLAVTAPRFLTGHYTGSFGQSRPRLGSLTLQDGAAPAVIEELKRRGHDVSSQSAPLWWPVALRRDPKSGALHAAGDPQAHRHAAAY
jgi:gamma-glutamyltranspeptidase/glutathione hydrolase